MNAVVTQTDRHTKKNSTSKSVNLALQSHFQKEWKVDIESELASHRDNGTWTFVDAPDRGRSIISAMWGFRVNYTIVMDPWKNSKRCTQGLLKPRYRLQRNIRTCSSICVISTTYGDICSS